MDQLVPSEAGQRLRDRTFRRGRAYLGSQNAHQDGYALRVHPALSDSIHNDLSLSKWDTHRVRR